MKNQKGVGVVGILILLALIGATGGIAYLAKVKPEIFQSVSDKIKSIITPKAPIGNLTPARDLIGIWKSSLRGKGMQLYGKFEIKGSTTTIYENGDIEIKIESVENNIARGTIRYTTVCGWGSSIVPILGVVSVPKTCIADTGAQPIEIRVSSSALDFGTVTAGDITATMQGTFTTDIMSGSMTTTYPPYGVVKGIFNLSRVK